MTAAQILQMLPAEKHDELEQLFTDLANEMEEVVGESAVVDVEESLLEQLLARRQRRQVSPAVMSVQEAKTRLVRERRLRRRDGFACRRV